MLNDDNAVRKIIQLLIDNQDTEIKRIRFPIDGTEKRNHPVLCPNGQKRRKMGVFRCSQVFRHRYSCESFS